MNLDDLLDVLANSAKQALDGIPLIDAFVFSDPSINYRKECPEVGHTYLGVLAFWLIKNNALLINNEKYSLASDLRFFELSKNLLQVN